MLQEGLKLSYTFFSSGSLFCCGFRSLAHLNEMTDVRSLAKLGTIKSCAGLIWHESNIEELRVNQAYFTDRLLL